MNTNLNLNSDLVCIAAFIYILHIGIDYRSRK